MQLIGILSATGAGLFWAMAVIMFKKSGDVLSPTALNLFKGVVTLGLMIPTLWIVGIPLFPDRPVSDWLLLGTSGLLGITIADNLFFMSLRRLGAGMWAVVDCLYLPCIIVMSTLFLDESIGIKGIAGAGLVVAAIGAGSLSNAGISCSRKDLLIGFSLGAMHVTLLAGSIIMVKPLLEQTHILWASFVRLLAGALGLMVISALHPQRRTIFDVLKPSLEWRMALPATVVGNYLAMLAWLAGFKYTLVSVAAILNQLSTIFTFVLAAVFLKEPVTLPRFIAIILALSGALLAASVA